MWLCDCRRRLPWSPVELILANKSWGRRVLPCLLMEWGLREVRLGNRRLRLPRVSVEYVLADKHAGGCVLPALLVQRRSRKVGLALSPGYRLAVRAIEAIRPKE